MTATVSGGQTDSMFFGNWVGSSILDEARPHNVVKPLLKLEGRRPGLVFNFPIQDDPAGATANQTEGTAFTETVLATSSAVATARLNGQVATVTDVLDAISIVDAVSHFSQVLGRSVAEEFEITATALFASATHDFSAASLAGFYNGMADLEGAEATGEFVAVLKPAMLATIRTDVVISTSAFQGGPASMTEASTAHPNGYVGPIAGVPTYMTTAAATSALFIKGVTFGAYEVWDSKTETHRDAFQPGTQIAATSLWGGACIRAAWAADVA